MDNIEIPFDKSRFSNEIKQCVSGVNITLDYANIASSVAKSATFVKKILGKNLYSTLCNTKDQDTDLYVQAKDFLKRAIAHFSIYEHMIYLITRISNNGITVEKNEKSTTVYKYLQDQLSNDLITTSWYWMNMLIELLRDNNELFPEFDLNKYEEIPIGAEDFERWVGVADAYFPIVTKWLIREVWDECVLSRIKEPVKTKLITRAICYEVMARACVRLSYINLPAPIRLDISNEMSKTNKDLENKRIREFVSNEFKTKANLYWSDLDMELQKQAMKDRDKLTKNRPFIGEKNISQNDKFFFN